jgi:hypothetical protein
MTLFVALVALVTYVASMLPSSVAPAQNTRRERLFGCTLPLAVIMPLEAAHDSIRRISSIDTVELRACKKRVKLSVAAI